MKFSTAAIAAFLSAAGVTAFTQKPASTFIQKRSSSSIPALDITQRGQSSGCAYAVCVPRLSQTTLFQDVAEAEETDVEVPAEVEAMDGINSEEEAHNAGRPARKSLKKKGPKGTPLAELSEGQTLTGRVKTVTSYGAFMDIGAESDGLLHISNLSVDYVADVSQVLEQGKEYEVRIIKIDESKKQVGLSLLSEAQEEEQQANVAAAKPAKRERTKSKKDDSATLAAMQEKGWETSTFVEGTVVKTLDFGAFVRVDCSPFGVEGQMDGLVHISALAAGRVDNVDAVVRENEKVQVRVKGIDKGKVSLTMVTVEEEDAKQQSRGGGRPQEFQGNKNWKEDLGKFQEDLPVFSNKPVIVDNRK